MPGGVHWSVSSRPVAMSASDEGADGAVVQDTAVIVTISEGAPAPPAVTARTRACHVPAGTLDTRNSETNTCVTGANTALPAGAASTT